jgi:hypothetical protein
MALALGVVFTNAEGVASVGTFDVESQEGAVPEPASLTLLALGLAAAGARLRAGRSRRSIES